MQITRYAAIHFELKDGQWQVEVMHYKDDDEKDVSMQIGFVVFKHDYFDAAKAFADMLVDIMGLDRQGEWDGVEHVGYAM